MCHPARLGIALLTTYVALATAVIDGSRNLNLDYLPINLSSQLPQQQQRTQDMIHSRHEDLIEPNSDGGFPDQPNSDELNTRQKGNIPNQRTEDLEELALAFLADKLQGTVVDDALPIVGIPDHRQRATLQDNIDLEELMDSMVQAGEADTKSRLPRQTFDLRQPRDQREMAEQLGEQGNHLVNCRSGRLNWPPCALFNGPDTAPMLHEAKQDVILNQEDTFADFGSEVDDQTPADSSGEATRRKRDTEMAEGNEISRSTRQASPQSHVLPSKIRKGFSPWGGKRAPPFGSWGGKRAPDFHSWGGKRAQGGLKSHKKQMSNPSAWEGKRVPAFHSWGGKRAPAFNSWGGKRAPAFNSWGGKRAPAFNSWGGKRAPAFNSWGGKRAPSFHSWGGKRVPFNSWGGKRVPFNSWGGKRAPSFNSWGGKRAPAFNSWGGKRVFEELDENSEDRLGAPLVIPADDSQFSNVNEIEKGALNLISDGHWVGPWEGKWPWASPDFDKQKASEQVTQIKPPKK